MSSSTIYRSDVVAARARRDMLQAEAEQLEREAQRFAETSRRLREVRAELALLEQRIEAAGKARRPSRRALRLALLIVPMGAIGGGALLLAPGLIGHKCFVISPQASAQSVVALITRSVVLAYENGRARDGSASGSRPLHADKERVLCASALSVPTEVPQRSLYSPIRRDGWDYLTGDWATGWKCLGYDPSWPQRFRYHYHQGSGYLGPARGGPDPGPNGFEVAAEGDLDGDGETSLFTRVGWPDPVTGDLVLSETLFIDRESE